MTILRFALQSTKLSSMDDGIVVNYRGLSANYKDPGDEDEVKKISQELTSNVNKLDATLSRIAAPNMKAVSKYVVCSFVTLKCYFVGRN